MKTRGIPKILFIIFLLGILLTSCQVTYQTKADYFAGNATVDYVQSSVNDSTLTLTFNERGGYNVAFSYTPGHYFNNRPLPANFTVEVTDNPKTKVITQRWLPSYLTVTITHGEIVESHDFQ